jgi:hypothetical protein
MAPYQSNASLRERTAPFPLHPFKDHGDWKMLIGGDFVRGSGAGALQVTNPVTGELLGEAPSGSREDVSDAVTAAKRAYRDRRWSQPERRGEMLFAMPMPFAPASTNSSISRRGSPASLVRNA